MSDHDDHVIPYEEAVRRHRAKEAEKRKGVIHEVKISDAMVHLLEGETAQETEGPSPTVLRSIVEREFTEEEVAGRSGREPVERPGDGHADEHPADGPICRLDEPAERTPRD